MPDQVRKMTWKQVRDILFHPRDDHGSLEVEYSDDGPPDTAELMRRQWRSEGLNEREIAVKFAEFNEMLYAEQVCKEKAFSADETARQLAVFKSKLMQQRAGKGMTIRS